MVETKEKLVLTHRENEVLNTVLDIYTSSDVPETCEILGALPILEKSTITDRSVVQNGLNKLVQASILKRSYRKINPTGHPISVYILDAVRLNNTEILVKNKYSGCKNPKMKEDYHHHLSMSISQKRHWLKKIHYDINYINDALIISQTRLIKEYLMRSMRDIPPSQRNVKHTYLYKIAQIINYNHLCDAGTFASQMRHNNVTVVNFLSTIRRGFAWKIKFNPDIFRGRKVATIMKMEVEQQTTREARSTTMKSETETGTGLSVNNKLEVEKLFDVLFKEKIAAIRDAVRDILPSGVDEKFEAINLGLLRLENEVKRLRPSELHEHKSVDKELLIKLVNAMLLQ